MSTQTRMTDAERSAVKKEVEAFYKEMINTFISLDIDRYQDMCEDPFGLGTIFNGVLHPDLDELKAFMRKDVQLRTYQEVKEMEDVHVGILAPDLAMVTNRFKAAIHLKDESIYIGLYASSFLMSKASGIWKCVPQHISWNEVKE